jgi:uncharacterized protein YegJ (DUF2314 family)
MTWKLKGTLLAAAVASATFASQAQATFQYDLRLAPGQTGAVDSHDVLLSSTTPTTYNLQLWGQITGTDTNLTNDAWVSGFVSEESVQGVTPAITSGSVVATALGTHVNNVAALGSSANITNDGISDWGSGTTTATTGYTLWRSGAATAYTDGTADNQSEQVGPNTWEVLLATYTVTITGQSSTAGTTTIAMLLPTQVKSGISPINSIAYTQDGVANQSQFSNIGNVVFTTTGGGGGTTTPEPASLGVLALGGLALMNRRRKA